MLAKQIYQKSVVFFIIGIFQVQVLNMIQKYIHFNDVVIGSVKGSGYRIPFWYMSKDDNEYR